MDTAIVVVEREQMFVIARRDEDVRLELTLLPHIALERRHRVAGIRWQPRQDCGVEASLLSADSDMQTSRCDDRDGERRVS